jgi:hypothetical protein
MKSDSLKPVLGEQPAAQNPDAGKPACHALPRIPLHLWDDYRCGLDRDHEGDHRAISRERLRWHDEPEQPQRITDALVGAVVDSVLAAIELGDAHVNRNEAEQYVRETLTEAFGA